MENIGTLLLVVAVALIVVGVALRRRKPAAGSSDRPSRRAAAAPPPTEVEVARPTVAEMHVVGDEARVTFDVPLPEKGDDVLADVLLGEAIEVVREKRHHLPMSNVTAVVALAGRDPILQVGRAILDGPGVLPPAVKVRSILNLATIAADPLEENFGEPFHPGTAIKPPTDHLGSIGAEVRLPRAVETGLRAQGIDPDTMSAGELITGMLSLVGYRITPGLADQTFMAEKGGAKTFIRQDSYSPGDHPEVDLEALGRFAGEFRSSGAARGLYVSDKYAPFEVYERERRDPQVRYVTRERLQRMVDALALS